MQITRGKIQTAQKVIIYGPEGIGKSTLASMFPGTLFIDTEGSTKHMDVARLQKPSSWAMLLEEVRYVKSKPDTCNTLVIDTADWAERICIEEICSKYKKTGIEDFGYGKGYVYLEEEFGRLLNLLEELIERDINVVFTAHAQTRKFEQPDEMGSYDRWEMKLEKKTSPMLKEWADMVLFANYKTHVVNVDNQGALKGKNKVQGGTRVMYTAHHPCWDAKNRHNLPEEVEFNYSSIVHCIPSKTTSASASALVQPSTAIPVSQPSSESVNQPVGNSETKPTQAPVQNIPQSESQQRTPEDLSSLPKSLSDLMIANNVDIREIQYAVSNKGYYPRDTPIANYDPSFISGVLVGAWPQVFKMILDNRPLPF